jgi:triphosphoribosyl-dephospho-CoA synthase
MEKMNKKEHRLAEAFAKLAEEALLTEVLLTPKPGLVDVMDSGSHEDMDIFTFIKSAVSLRCGFKEMFLAGYTSEVPEDELLGIIRPIGIEMEKEMFEATEGVNTHKGTIFSMGLFLAASGIILKENCYEGEAIPELIPMDSDRIFKAVMKMTNGIVTRDFANIKDKTALTHGERLYLAHGFTGIRGEAEKGYPVLQYIVLPYLKNKNNILSYKEILLEVLLLLMEHLEDSNIVTRGGMEGLLYVRESAARFLEEGGLAQDDAINKLHRMNKVFIEKNLSPGGSADLLSIAVFLGKLLKLL